MREFLFLNRNQRVECCDLSVVSHAEFVQHVIHDKIQMLFVDVFLRVFR